MLAIAIAAIVGLVVGSFLGTLVLRPPKGMPVASGRSMCPHCAHRLSAAELIPLVSWIVQGRRCRACRRPISSFYPLMEIAGALVAVLSVILVPWPLFVAACLGGWLLLVAAGRLFVKGV
jgi:prepilin signal peptidase PulO-like enzyme (type II secretory pathway)